jgi:Fic family protein
VNPGINPGIKGSDRFGGNASVTSKWSAFKSIPPKRTRKVTASHSRDCDTIPERKSLLERLGGLSETFVQNAEWPYLRVEDSRQSLAIEGHRATEDDLAAALGGAKTGLEIANYLRAAQTIYDQALQYCHGKINPPLDLPTIRHIHSELFRGFDRQRREFRHAAIIDSRRTGHTARG